jgi:RHS repeat-associated protein
VRNRLKERWGRFAVEFCFGRSFSYSSLSRLTNANNPESGLTCYGYDPDGNLASRTQGASGCSPVSGGITTTWPAYDNLNQVTGKSYSDGTASASYGYTVDWLKSTTSGSNVFQNLSFDGFGRVTSSSQTTNGTTYTFGSYSYNYLDGLTSMAMPSGRVINTPRDSSNRVTGVSGVMGGTTNYASSIVYAPHGAVTSMALGNTLNGTVSFNSRLQAGSMSLGTSPGGSDIWSLSNAFSGSQNNGNVLGQALSVPGMSTLNTTYTYDGVNRLSVAAENSSNPSNPPCPDASSQWCRGYNYYAGGYGNRKTASLSGQGLSTLEPATFNASNQIADAGWSYLEHGSVARGNVTQQKNGATFAYDAENRQVAYCPNDANPANCLQTAGNGRTLYYYDGDGRRVETVAADGTTMVFVYDAAGNLAAEYGSQPPLPCSTCYVTTDHLGSTRVLTDGNGCAVWRSDYLPFGETILATGGSPRLNATGGTKCSANGYLAFTGPRLQFTGQARDSETGMDYFQTRYMSSAQGRFTSPDEPFAGFDQHDPQSFNLYSYIGNNPLRYTDPDGHDVQVCVTGSDNNQNCFNLNDAQYKQLYNQQNGQQGIGLPSGTFPTGNITCGGQNCGTATYFEPSMQDDTVNVAMFLDFGASLAKGAFRGIVGLFARDAGEEGGVVIGKMADLNGQGALRQGERQLDLPNLNNPKANWAQNSGKLREAMSEGKPIRDASGEPLAGGRPANNTGFLRAERNLLENHGWSYRGGYWYPPAK